MIIVPVSGLFQAILGKSTLPSLEILRPKIAALGTLLHTF
jgi:hypothetical protein